MKRHFLQELFNPDIKNLFTLRQKVIYVFAGLIIVTCFLVGFNRFINGQYFLMFINGAVLSALLCTIFIAKKGHISIAAILLSIILIVPSTSVINNDISRIADNGIYLALVPIVNLFLIQDKRISFLIFLICTFLLGYFFDVAQLVFIPFLTIFLVHMVYFFFFSIHIDKLEKELISENKRKARLIKDLEIKNQEIEQLNKNLESTNKALQERVEDVQQFAYLSSHNLQTPLHNIQVYSSLLKEEYAPKLDELGITSVDYLNNSASSLSSILHGLVDYFSTFEQGATEVIPVELVITNILREEIALLNEKNTTIQFQDLPVITGRRKDIKRLFQSIIQNALIHNQSIKNLEISILFKPQAEGIQFSIIDNGIGIPEKDFAKIFKVYVSSISFSKGIGLAIAKKIVGNYNGKIWVESTVGKGTAIHFTLQTDWQQA